MTIGIVVWKYGRLKDSMWFIVFEFEICSVWNRVDLLDNCAICRFVTQKKIIVAHDDPSENDNDECR